jgi:hypothetical protein
MTIEFLADLQQGASPEDIRALKWLRDNTAKSASVETLASLVDQRLAWVGPPPEHEHCVSYRGRQALRDNQAIVTARAGFASALRRSRDMRH